ncbi:MAG TPA: LysR family transcriptional regulator [Methylomirabilota bacterium]|nr:LysR family transcriptional regulator [Methylomirabilota bacterium]
MELHHLRAFVAVADTLHFGRAAESLSISQPPLSRRVAELERIIGARVFERTRRSVRLSDVGRALLGEARAILGQVDRLATVAAQVRHGEIGHLAVGLAAGVDFTPLLLTIRDYGERYPGIRLDLQGLPSPEQIVGLREGWLHVGLLRPPLTDRSLVAERILSEEILVALPEHHPLARRARVATVALRSEPCVLFKRQRGPAFYDSLITLCRKAGFSLNVKYEVDRFETVRGFVAAGVGFAFVPSSLRTLPSPGVTYRRLHPDPPRIDLLIAWRRDNTAPPVHSFVQMMRRAAPRRGPTPAPRR